MKQIDRVVAAARHQDLEVAVLGERRSERARELPDPLGVGDDEDDGREGTHGNPRSIAQLGGIGRSVRAVQRESRGDRERGRTGIDDRAADVGPGAREHPGPVLAIARSAQRETDLGDVRFRERRSRADRR